MYDPKKEVALAPLSEIAPDRFRTIEILEVLVEAKSSLMALNQASKRLPNPNVLINTLGIQEAKTSSEIESVYTTVRDLFSQKVEEQHPNPAAKEVERYRIALEAGHKRLKESGLLTVGVIVEIANALNGNQAGIRRVPGVVIADSLGEIVHTPPQDYDSVVRLLSGLERFINDASIAEGMDPLIKMALIHWHFESIHPFGDGNGRTGRILNVLYLVRAGLLDQPILYLSRQILATKHEYYQRLRAANQQGDLDGMVVYLLRTVAKACQHNLGLIDRIVEALREYKHGIRDSFAFYSQDLINMLFVHVSITHQSMMKELGISRATALKYLGLMTDANYLVKAKVGRRNFYINRALLDLLEEDELRR